MAVWEYSNLTRIFCANLLHKYKDLTQITRDQQAFIAQRDSAYGKKTMKAWYWKVCGEEYDETLNG